MLSFFELCWALLNFLDGRLRSMSGWREAMNCVDKSRRVQTEKFNRRNFRKTLSLRFHHFPNIFIRQRKEKLFLLPKQFRRKTPWKRHAHSGFLINVVPNFEEPAKEPAREPAEVIEELNWEIERRIRRIWELSGGGYRTAGRCGKNCAGR